MKKITNISIWLGIVLYLIIALSFVTKKHNNTICSHINVHIKDSLQDKFISEKDITNFIHEVDMKVLGMPIKKINTRKLEQMISKKSVIKSTEIYFVGNGDMNIKIDQRNPILRVVNRKGQSYYIDNEGAIIPVRGDNASHTLIASGEIIEFFELAKTDWLKCPDKRNKEKNYSICQIYEMAKFIHSHPFWESQVEQIYLNKKGEYEIVPRVGAHLIKLGSHDNFREKFRNLKAFYKKGLNNVGWNQYLIINLKYDNQIICKKR